MDSLYYWLWYFIKLSHVLPYKCPVPRLSLSYVCLVPRLSCPTFVCPTFVHVPRMKHFQLSCAFCKVNSVSGISGFPLAETLKFIFICVLWDNFTSPTICKRTSSKQLSSNLLDQVKRSKDLHRQKPLIRIYIYIIQGKL